MPIDRVTSNVRHFVEIQMTARYVFIVLLKNNSS